MVKNKNKWQLLIEAIKNEWDGWHKAIHPQAYNDSGYDRCHCCQISPRETYISLEDYRKNKHRSKREITLWEYGCPESDKIVFTLRGGGKIVIYRYTENYVSPSWTDVVLETLKELNWSFRAYVYK